METNENQIVITITADTKQATKSINELKKSLGTIKSSNFNFGAIQKSFSNIERQAKITAKTITTAFGKIADAQTIKSNQKQLEKVERTFANQITTQPIPLKVEPPKGNEFTKAISQDLIKVDSALRDVQTIGQGIGYALGQSFSSVKKEVVDGFVAPIKEATKNCDTLKGIIGAISGLTSKVGKDNDKSANSVKKQESSWSRIGKSIKRIMFYRLVRSVYQALENLVKQSISSLYSLSEQLGSSFAPALDSLKTSFTYLANAIMSVVAPILETLAPIITSVLDGLAEMANYVAQLMASFMGADSITQATKKLQKFNAEAKKTSSLGIDELNVLSSDDDTSGMFEIFENTNKQASGLIGILSQIGDIIKNIISGSGLADLLSSVFNIIQKILNAISNSGLLNIINQLVAVVDKVFGVIGNVLDIISEPLNNALSSILSLVNHILEPVIRVLSSVLNILSPIIGMLSQIVGIIINIISPLVSVVDAILSPILEVVAQIFEVIESAFAPLLEAIYNGLMPLFDFINENVKEAIAFFIEFANTIISAIKLIVEPIKAIIKTIVAICTLNFGEIGNIWNDLCGKMSEIWEKVWKGIANFFIGIINGMATAIESFVNMFIKIINTITAGLSKAWTWLGIPAIPQIPEQHWGRIPALATGGIVEDGLFMANHGELVGGFSNGKTAVANNEQITDGIYLAVREALQDAGFGGSSNGNKESQINVYLNSKEIAKEVKRVEKENGVEIYNGAIYGK